MQLFSDLWSKLSDAEPEIDEKRSKEQVHRRAGPFGEGMTLEIGVSPMRFDLLFGAAETGEPGIDTFEPIAPIFEQILPKLADWAEKSSVTIARAAIGVSLLSEVKSRVDGYTEIVSIAKSLAFDPASNISDLSFQINHPLQSAVIEGLVINRLMKLSVSALKMLSIAVVGGQAGGGEVGPERHYVRMELDVNTAVPTPDNRALEKSKIGAIFKELSEVMLKMAAEGEP